MVLIFLSLCERHLRGVTARAFVSRRRKYIERDIFFLCINTSHWPKTKAAPGLGAQREKRRYALDNEYTAVGILLDNVGQTCGVHVS